MKPPFWLATVGLLGLLACSDSGAPTEHLKPVASVVVTPVEGVTWAGDVRQLEPILLAADGTSLRDRPVLWSSSDTSVAAVDAAGRMDARRAGTTVITATSEGRRGETTVSVAELDLIYEGYRTGLPEIFTLSLRGGEPTRLLPPHTIVTSPTPSPDGTRIAFVVGSHVDGVMDIYVVDRDGTNLRQLTSSSEIDDHPAWSPDGNRIAFRSYRTQRQGGIWVMNADGSDPVLLTPDPLPATIDAMRPAWSPDGSRIAYASNEGGSMNLWTMRADGSDKRQLTNTMVYDTEPAWSPDGQWIAFRRSSPELGSDLMIIPSHGGAAVRFSQPEHDILPAWSPDGRLIAFARFRVGGGSPQIYTMRPDGSEITLRTSDYAWNGGTAPKWILRSR